MAKTNPIGVRFDQELLNSVKEAGIADSPQKALNLYERSYLELLELKVAENKKPENKARIEKERNPAKTQVKDLTQEVAKSNYTIDTTDNQDKLNRIATLKTELKNPPKSPLIGMKAWVAVREKEIAELENQLQSS
jgi:hypothetical protein